MNTLKSTEKSGFASLFVLGGMLLVAVSLPIATKLVQQSQENRSSAAEKCSCSDKAYGDAMNCSKAGKKWTCPTICTYTCTAWSSCSNLGNKTCTNQTKSPDNCTGGTPVIGTTGKCYVASYTSSLECGSGDTKCDNGKAYDCKDGKWNYVLTCEYGCDQDRRACGTKREDSPSDCSSSACGKCDEEKACSAVGCNWGYNGSSSMYCYNDASKIQNSCSSSSCGKCTDEDGCYRAGCNWGYNGSSSMYCYNDASKLPSVCYEDGKEYSNGTTILPSDNEDESRGNIVIKCNNGKWVESPRPDCICGTTPGECVVGSNIGSREFYDHNDGTNGLRWSCSNEICSPAECEWFNTESCTDLDSETASMKNGDSGFIEKYVRLTCFEGRWIKTPISDCICGSTVNTCQGAAEPRMEENYPDFSTGKNTYSWDCRNDDVCQTVSCSIVSKNKCFDSSGYVHENGSKISRGEGIFKCVDGLWVADSVSNNTTSQSSPITGDVDGNGIVNTVDFSLVKTGKDINGDGVSNALDMGIVKNSLLEG